MTNENRFAIYFSSFHLADLWFKGEAGVECGGSLLSGERTLTFLAEGDRQAGDSGVLQSISVQVCGTSMVTWSR